MSETDPEHPPLPEELGPLNPEQSAAVTHVDGPLLVLAGAGSGKTRVLTRRIAYLLHVGIEPEHILAVTFTNKAAAEMKERVAELVGDKGNKVWVSTFHSSCCRILRQEAPALGYTNRFAIYDDDDQLRVLRQIVSDLGYDKKVVVPKAMLSRIDHHKNRMERREGLVEAKRLRTTDPLARIWEHYEDRLRAADALDFNDLIGKVVELFRDHEEILAKYRETFQYVMVDEYQDTNRAQYQVIELLTRGHRNLAVVGDDDQSIYGFRGADIRNIRDFEQDYPDAKIVRMERNYRCTERILDVANAIISHNPDRIDKQLYTEIKRGGELVQLASHDDPRAEAAWVAGACSALRRRGIDWGEMAVIYRTNATSQPFEKAFLEHGVPHKVVGGRPFYSRREVRDALSYLRLVSNPADDAAFIRICNVPTRGIGTTTLKKLRDAAAERGEPLMKAARSYAVGADRTAKAVSAFVDLVDELIEVLGAASLPAFLHEVLQRSGYAQSLRDEDTREARERLDNLNTLLADAADYEPDGDGPELTPAEQLPMWLDRISLTGADEEIPEGGEVALLTVHSAKGLEYPVVFVVNMVDGQFPHSRSAEDPEGFKEERRLAYVAFTRAKDRLYVSRCRHRLTFDGKRGRMGRELVARSPFLDQMPRRACTGDLPTPDEHLEPMGEPQRARDPGEPTRARLRRVIAARGAVARPARVFGEPAPAPRARRTDPAPAPSPAAPADPPAPADVVEEDAVRTRPVRSWDDLTKGTRVLHARHGVGHVISVRPPRITVMFRAGMEIVGVGDEALQILSE